MNVLVKYKKRIMIILSFLIIMAMGYGIIYLKTTLSNIQFSKNDAHNIALQTYQGTVVSSEVAFIHQQVVYKIQIEDKSKRLLEIEISAQSGNVIGFEYIEFGG